MSSKTKDEPAVVALWVVVHEATSKLNSAIGVMVHLTSNLQPQVIHFFHNSPINFFQLFFWWFLVIQYFLIWSNGSFIIRTINVYFVSQLGRSLSSSTLSSITKEEPAVVALQVVVHEATSKLNLAIGVMVHLFGSEVKVVMISWITSFRKWKSFGRKWRKYEKIRP